MKTVLSVVAAFATTCMFTASAYANGLGHGSYGYFGFGNGHAQSAQAIDLPETPDGAASPADSAGVLVRKFGRIDADLFLAGLDPNTYYSLWWVIYNQPSACSNGECVFPDDVIGGAGHSFNAGGFVSGADGVANVSASLQAGLPPKGRDRVSRSVTIIDPETEVGLRRPKAAEISIIVRSHGPIGSAQPDVQMTTFDGGCTPFPFFEGCRDDQIITFAPTKRSRGKR